MGFPVQVRWHLYIESGSLSLAAMVLVRFSKNSPFSAQAGLTHQGRVTHISVSIPNHNYFRSRLACLTPSHYLNQCCRFVNWATESNSQWIRNPNTIDINFIQENEFENICFKMVTILSLPRFLSPMSMYQLVGILLIASLCHIMRLLVRLFAVHDKPDWGWVKDPYSLLDMNA